MTVDQLRELAPAVPWDDYFKALGVEPPDILNVAQPEFIAALARELHSTPLGAWRVYLRWQLLHRAAPELGAAFVDEHFDFYSRTLTGTTTNQPRWKRCVRSTEAALSQAVGQAYVRKYFSAATRARASRMVDDLITAFRSDIETLDWMTSSTRAQAIAKLDALATRIGYPERWRSYSGLDVDRHSNVLNALRAAEFEFRYDLERIGRPVDRAEWTMSPQTVNASYHAADNEIVFPAAVLQPPLFDLQADDALNYGGMGALIRVGLLSASRSKTASVYTNVPSSTDFFSS